MRIYSSTGLLTSISLLAQSFYSLQTNTNVKILKGFSLLLHQTKILKKEREKKRLAKILAQNTVTFFCSVITEIYQMYKLINCESKQA